MDSEEPGGTAPDALPADGDPEGAQTRDALPVVVHVSEDDPRLGLAVIEWRNGDPAARDRVVSNLGGRLATVVEHVAPGRDPVVAGHAVRRALDEAGRGGGPAALPGASAPLPHAADWNRRPAAVAASLALWHLARALGVEPTSFSGPAAELDVAEQAALRLLDVDLATWSQVGELWGANPNDVLDVHADARRRLGMDEPGRGFCPSWPAVRTSHMAPPEERSAVKWHVLECQACTQSITEAAARRTRLLRLLPERVGRGSLLPGVGSVLRGFLAIPAIDHPPADDRPD